MKKKTIPFAFTKCTICFKLVKDIDYHHDEYHAVTHWHSCEKCEYKTKRKDNLLRHERHKHAMFNKQLGAVPKFLNNNSDWTCHDCGKTFAEEKEIENHLIMKCDEEKNICKLCGKKFPLHSNLKRHIRTVHERQQKYSCEKCGKKFKHEFSQRRHMSKCKDNVNNN